ncbi:ParB family protein [Microbacterium sp. IO18]|uniref:ParB family protein n=1 Tax=Microbacterium sp. IO18 TaxID=3390997 RepID=UPI003BA08CC0
MSDAPRRQLGNLSALDRMKGTGQPAATVTPTVATPAPAERPEPPAAPVSAPQAAQKAPTRPKSRAEAPKAVQRPIPLAEGSPTEKMSTYIPRSTRDRAKAAFRATGHLEGDGSFSEFIASAIAREVERREQLYNDGQPYAGDGGRLTAGRPLS